VNGGRDGRTIDWASVRHALDLAIAATDETAAPSREQELRILEARARELARVPVAADTGARLEVVTFALANERYAIESRHVLEIVRLTRFTAVPPAPDFILGVTNLRGEVIIILDTRRVFGLTVAGLTDLSRLLVIGDGQPDFALIADSVSSVQEMPAAAFGPPPALLPDERSRYVRAVGPDALVLIDGDALRGDAGLYVDQD
jgi:purine-binding chemotaxis protein CheW